MGHRRRACGHNRWLLVRMHLLVRTRMITECDAICVRICAWTSQYRMAFLLCFFFFFCFKLWSVSMKSIMARMMDWLALQVKGSVLYWCVSCPSQWYLRIGLDWSGRSKARGRWDETLNILRLMEWRNLTIERAYEPLFGEGHTLFSPGVVLCSVRSPCVVRVSGSRFHA